MSTVVRHACLDRAELPAHPGDDCPRQRRHEQRRGQRREAREGQVAS